MRKLIEEVLKQALSEARSANVPIYTFALYYDHESSAISVCIDTAEKSAATVASINAYNGKYFHGAVAAGNLEGASLWQANIGRSLSLGDFHLVNVARRELGCDFRPEEEFFVSLVQGVVAVEPLVAEMSVTPESLLLCCSGPDSEVQYWWSLSAQGPNNSLQGRRP